MKKKNILEIKKIYLAGKIDLMKEFVRQKGSKEIQEAIKYLEEDWDKFYRNLLNSEKTRH